MKALHEDGFWGWSSFDDTRNLDFHSLLWCSEQGNIMVDPVPLTDHDRAHVDALGGVGIVVITNSDHMRDSVSIAKEFGASLAAPEAEAEGWPVPVDRWLHDGDELCRGCEVISLDGSKTPGELALVIDSHTLVCGDLVRGHRGGRLNLLPTPKLKDEHQAQESVRRLLDFPRIETVLVGDGWHVFVRGHEALKALVSTF